jgi:hypothetical protein
VVAARGHDGIISSIGNGCQPTPFSNPPWMLQRRALVAAYRATGALAQHAPSASPATSAPAPGNRARDSAHADAAPRASHIFDKDGLTERKPHTFCYDASNYVHWSTRGERHSHGDGPRRIVLSRCNLRAPHGRVTRASLYEYEANKRIAGVYAALFSLVQNVA